LALGFLALLVYGSLVPFDYRPVPWGEAVARLRAACALPVRVESRSDWAANVVLYVPLGFLSLAALAVDRRWPAGLAWGLLVVPACAALSAAIEFTQLYFPPRVTSLNDIVANAGGAAVGVFVWLTMGERLTGWLRRFWSGLGTYRGWALRSLAAYLAVLVLVETTPFDLTLSPVDLYHKYRAGRVRWVPFAAGEVGPFDMIQKSLVNIAYFLPAGVLLAGLPGRPWRHPRHWPRVLAAGLAMAAGVELLQLFVYTRFFDVTDIFTGGFAVLTGWALALACGWLRPPASPAPTAHGSGVTQPRRPEGRALGLRIVTLLGWLGLLVFVNWQPFNFNPSRAFAAHRLRQLSWVPFADYSQGNYLNAFDQIAQKAVLFVPVGALLTAGSAGRRWARPLVLIAAADLAAGLEAGQLMLPTRYASITDVLIETFGAWIGFAVAGRARAARAQEQGYHSHSWSA
jgi:glycopeptide antibiotics resistance protein